MGFKYNPFLGTLDLVSVEDLSGYVTGNGVVNKLAFWSSSSNITYDSQLSWNSGLNRLGVNTATPYYNLHTEGTAYSSTSMNVANNWYANGKNVIAGLPTTVDSYAIHTSIEQADGEYCNYSAEYYFGSEDPSYNGTATYRCKSSDGDYRRPEEPPDGTMIGRLIGETYNDAERAWVDVGAVKFKYGANPEQYYGVTSIHAWDRDNDRELITLRGDSSKVGINENSPGVTLDVGGNCKIQTLPNYSVNDVVVENAGILGYRTANSKIWGTLLDGTGSATRIPYYVDADTFGNEEDFTYNYTTNTLNVDNFGLDNSLIFDGQTLTSVSTGTSDNDTLVTKGYVDDNEIASPLTTKGDIYTYDSDNARLPVGTDGQYLVADSAESTGLKWQTLSVDSDKITGSGYVTVEIDGTEELNIDGTSADFTHYITCGGSSAGQSIIASGLVVNEGGGNTADDDFRVETDTVSNALFVDASADEVQVNASFKMNDLVNIAPGSTPGSPSEGDIYMDSTTHKLRCYDGTSWNDLW